MPLRPSSVQAESPLPAPPVEPRTTGFGTTIFDTLLPGVGRPAAPVSVFDVCHVGVMLRAVLFVHCAIGIAALFIAADFVGWLTILSTGASAGLPGVLLWLVLACAGKGPFGALPIAGQWGMAIALGAVSGAAGSLLPWIAVGELQGGPGWLAPAVAGAAMAAVMFQWLRSRALAALPADATARLAELQSRIRPHFLFNTLNTALVLVRLDPARAEGVLEDLAELFRVAISDSVESVSLDEEVELARRYLAIEQVRFGARMQVSWELDPDAGHARLPPLLLQPLVENAVRHGIEPGDSGGSIRVRTRVKLGRALISIVNTVPSARSVPGSGIALRNVRERLRLMHDVAAQFETRREEEVFRVQIVVPL
jgi:two-component system sensor histidine kinase AlgZ